MQNPADAPFNGSAQTTKLLSSHLAEALTRFEAPTAEGKTALISLDAVALAFGKRWTFRSEQVYAHAERTLERLVGAQGYFLRVSETDFLVCQPELGSHAGQAVCLRALREIAGHFLGSAHLADGGIHRVTKLSREAIEAERLDGRSIEAEAEREAPPAKAPLIVDASIEHATFVTPSGQALRVSCVLEPVFELKHYNRIGMRLARNVVSLGSNLPLDPGAIRLLSGADIIRADLVTLERGIDRLRSDAEGQHPTLILPISYVSLASPRGRLDIIRAIKEAGSLVQQGVICEICDIDGVPPSAIAEVVAVVRPLTLYLLGGISTADPRKVAALKGSGLRGVTLGVDRRTGVPEAARGAIEASRRISFASILHGVSSSSVAAEYALLGATHVSLRAVGGQAGEELARPITGEGRGVLRPPAAIKEPESRTTHNRRAGPMAGIAAL